MKQKIKLYFNQLRRFLIHLIFAFIAMYSNLTLAQSIEDHTGKTPSEKLDGGTVAQGAKSGNTSEGKSKDIIKQYVAFDKSGDMSLTVPVYVVKGKHLKLPINLNNQAGVKVNQQASAVGLGWNMNLGSITRDYGAFEPDYTSTIPETEMYNTVTGLNDGVINSEDNNSCTNCSFTPINPFDKQRHNLRYNKLHDGSPNQLTPDDYNIVIPGVGGNTFWNNGNAWGSHNFIFNEQVAHKVDFSVNTFTIPQEFSRINEINRLNSALNVTNINNNESYAAAIAIYPYVRERQFGKYVNDLYQGTGSLPTFGTYMNVKYEDFGSFTITIEDGTKYIYGKPLRGQKYLFSESPYWSTFHPVDNSYSIGTYLGDYSAGEWWKTDYIKEWMLTAILSSDYSDANGNGIPDQGDSGDWIRIDYESPVIQENHLGFSSTAYNYREWTNFSQTDRASSGSHLFSGERHHLGKKFFKSKEEEFNISYAS